MSLIPFILDLADELQEYQRCLVGGSSSLMDIDDVDFGLQSLHEAGTLNHSLQQSQQQQQQSQTEQRRPRLLSQLYWPSNILQKQHHSRHHPYHLSARFGCTTKGESGAHAGTLGIKTNSIAGLANKPTTYPVINKNGWIMVSMNVKQFSPDELIVKTIDNCIIVEGRHEDKEDIHGVISRHFIRKYMLPKGYDPNEVVSTLSSDGILTVKAPPPAPPKSNDEGTERVVDIQQTGPAHVAAKQIPAAAVNLEEQISEKDIITPTEQAELKEKDKVQAEQIEAEPMLVEQSADEKLSLEETEKEQNANIASEQEEQQCDVDVNVANISNEDGKTAAEEIEGESIVEKPESIVAAASAVAAATTELLAKSTKPETQVDVSTPAEETDSIVNSQADTIDVPMDTVSAVDETVESAVDAAAATAATKNGNIDVELSNNTNEKNGVDDNEAVNNAEAPIPVTKTTILPAEVPASLDLGTCVPKSIVMEKTVAAAALGKDTVVEADTLDDNNVVETNSNGGGGGGDVGVDVGAAMIGVSPVIETMPAGGEELVAN